MKLMVLERNVCGTADKCIHSIESVVHNIYDDDIKG